MPPDRSCTVTPTFPARSLKPAIENVRACSRTPAPISEVAVQLAFVLSPFSVAFKLAPPAPVSNVTIRSSLNKPELSASTPLNLRVTLLPDLA